MRGREEVKGEVLLVDQYTNSMSWMACMIQDQFRRELAHARRRRNSMIPIHSLPHEILSAILILGMSSIDVFSTAISQLKRYCRYRNALTSVCYSWRIIIRSIPRLWAFISAELPSKLNNRALRLSKTHPLVCEDEIGDRGSANRAEQFWQSVRPHADRFQTIRAPTPNYILEMLGNGLQGLERLILNGRGVFVSPLDSPWPQLRHMALREVSLPWSRSLVSNLVSLELKGVCDLPLSVLMEVLRKSPQLERLKITGINPIMDQSVSVPVRIPLLSLKQLDIGYMSADLLTYILSVLEPGQLDMLCVTQKPDPRRPQSFPTLPGWTVSQAVQMLLRNNHVVLGSRGECKSRSFNINATPWVTLRWLAGVLDQYPKSSSRIRVRCCHLDLKVVYHYLPHQLDRCQITVETVGLTGVHYMCRRLANEQFPFPSIAELSIALLSNVSSTLLVDLLQERYCAPMQVKPLRKLIYKNQAKTPFLHVHTRMSEILKDCTVEWVGEDRDEQQGKVEGGYYSDQQVNSGAHSPGV